jgi:prepilin-type N-terminal cleavage/methylation domain-containing protein/prepilin-type processing-associated H-X9-DG protein
VKAQWRYSRGFTLLEILFVVLIIGILIALLMPTIAKSKLRAKRAQCTSNLRQQGVAFHLFAHDHNSRFPFEVSTNNGGSLEFMRLATNFGGEIYFSFRHYQALGPELDTPKILVCPTDTRIPAENFPNLRNENISYFISGTAIYENPMSVLGGDRNIETYDLGLRSVLRLDANDLPGWSAEMHQHQGNLLFADSHVEQVNNNGLRAALRDAPGGQVVLLPPVPVPPTATASAGQGGDSGGTSTAAANSGAQGNSASAPAASSPAKAQAPGSAPGMAATRNKGGSGSSRGPGMSGSEFASTGSTVTNEARTQSGATSAEANSEYKPDGWPAFIAHYITTFGAKATWLGLLIILSVLVYLEIRRRRAKVEKENKEMANAD